MKGLYHMLAWRVMATLSYYLLLGYMSIMCNILVKWCCISWEGVILLSVSSWSISFIMSTNICASFRSASRSVSLSLLMMCFWKMHPNKEDYERSVLYLYLDCNKTILHNGGRPVRSAPTFCSQMVSFFWLFWHVLDPVQVENICEEDMLYVWTNLSWAVLKRYLEFPNRVGRGFVPLEI